MDKPKIKGPAICGIIVLVLIFVENLIIGNDFLAALIRSIISGAFSFGLSFGLLFVVTKFKNDVEATENRAKQPVANENEDSEIGSNIDYTIDDSISESKDFESSNSAYSEEPLSFGGEDGEPYSFEDFMEDSGNGDNKNDVTSEPENVSYYSKPSNSEKTKELLDMNISEEDMAKAIRTVLKRDS